jgi:hypothetical protein
MLFMTLALIHQNRVGVSQFDLATKLNQGWIRINWLSFLRGEGMLQPRNDCKAS